MKKTILLSIAILLMFICKAELSKTINVTTPGSILTVLGNDYVNVTNLTVTGNIDARDFRLINYYMANLSVLDLSGANIGAYTGSSGPMAGSNVYPANTIPKIAFSPIPPDNYTAKLTSITLPTTTASVDNQAFYGCAGLTTVIIPSSVITTMVSAAFYGCSNLVSINIPSSVISLGASLFYGCKKLTTISIPSTVTSIANAVFSECSGLTSIYAYSSIPVDLSSSTYAFNNVNKATCILHVPVGAKSAYQSAVVWKDFNIQEGLSSAVNNATASQLKVYGTQSSIIVDGTSQGEMVEVYSLNGIHLQTIQSKGERFSIPVDSNAVYLVKTLAKTIKVKL